VKVQLVLLRPAEGGLFVGVAYQDTRRRISFRDGSSTVGFFCYSKQSPSYSEALLEHRRVKISDEDYVKSTDFIRSGTSPIVFYNTPLYCKFDEDCITRYGANEQDK
jgi:hypothetical protein